MSVETLKAELHQAADDPNSPLATLPEGDPHRPTPEALAEKHGISMEEFYVAVDEVIASRLPLARSTFYQRWVKEEGLE